MVDLFNHGACWSRTSITLAKRASENLLREQVINSSTVVYFNLIYLALYILITINKFRVVQYLILGLYILETLANLVN